MRSFIKKFFCCVLFLGLLAAAGISVALAVYVNKITEMLPSDEEIISYEANEASVVYDRNNKVITELFTENRRPMKLEEISRWMVMSILAAEDSEFYSHHGIRPLAIVRSLVTGEGGSGASTITQQLARNLFLTNEKSLDRKAKEAIISLRIEKLYTKDKLIETYLNAIYFGHGAWGIDAAAHSYFDKSAKDLTLAESSIIAGLVAAPERYSPIRNFDRARARQSYVLGRMVKLGWVSQEVADAAAAEELTFNKNALEKKQTFGAAPYFVSHILFKELLPQFGSDRVYKGGMQVYTTLDLDLQKAAEESAALLKHEGALVAMDPSTGAVLALVGGRDFDVTKFNRATQAYRQCGSAFKPIVYAAAVEAGYRPIDHILDRKVTFEVPGSTVPIWTPKNHQDKYVGEETLLRALALSHNVPAVKLTCLLGPDTVVEMARRMGVTSQYLSPILSVGLGVASVTPLEMAVVYSTFANDGARVEPYFISEIRNKNDEVIYSALPQQSEAMAPETAQMVRSMLSEVIRAGTGTDARIAGYEMFGKTGTTNDSTDAWFAGGVTGLVTVVYVGNDDLKPMGRNATGRVIALPCWSAFMKKAVNIIQPPQKFPEPSPQLAPMYVCTETGFLATSACNRKTNILMPIDKTPTTYCPTHGGGDAVRLPIVGPGDDLRAEAQNAVSSTEPQEQSNSFASILPSGYEPPEWAQPSETASLGTNDVWDENSATGDESLDAAPLADANIPKLLLIQQDIDMLQQEGSTLLEEEPAPAPAPEVKPVEEAPAVLPLPIDRPSAPPSRTEEPVNNGEFKSWRDYIKHDDRSVEERYQDLLKKYNIN